MAIRSCAIFNWQKMQRRRRSWKHIGTCLNCAREAAFPGWFRRIVLKHCDRLIRGKPLASVPLQAAEGWASQESDQAQAVEQREMKDKVLEAIDSLPDHERDAVMLYYISGHSQKEVGEFLDVPVTTVKKRLFSAEALA